MNMELYFSPRDSLLPLTSKIVTCFLVKLREETALDLLEETAGMSSAGFGDDNSEGRFWHTQDLGMSYPAIASLNPACFEILKIKKFQIQNILQETAITDEDTSLTTPLNTYRRFTWKLRMGNLIKTASSKKWKDLSEEDIAIKDRLYLIVHQGGNGSLLTPELDNGVALSGVATFNCRGTN